MSKGKSTNSKKILELSPDFREVLACRDRRQSPFVQIFVAEAENVSQKNLGYIFGVLEISDRSEDSSYIVNYLISIIKKEYFSRPKRGAIESFEAALHKANLALSKLAEHGDIRWIGKLNALIASIEKNNLHLSQAGTASAFLVRNNAITDISEGLASADALPHPMKTFENISSGRLENTDKIIVATEGLFELFSIEELKKSALRFSRDQFFQFLHTAMVNELDLAGALIIDIAEKVAVPVATSQQMETSSLNVFSQSAFLKTPDRKKKSEEKKTKAEKNIEKIIAGPYSYPSSDSQQEFVDEKSGHIYLKEDEAFLDKKPWWQESQNILQEKISEFLAYSKKKLSSLKVSAPKNKIATIATLPVAPKQPPKNWLAPIVKKLSSWGEKFACLPWKEYARLLAKITANGLKKFWHALIWLKNKISPRLFILWKKFLALNHQQKLMTVFVLVMVFLVPTLIVRWQNANDLAREKERMANLPQIPLANDTKVVHLENLTFFDINRQQKNILINLNGNLWAVTEKNVSELSTGKSWAAPDDFGSAVLAFGMNDLNLIFLINEKHQIISFAPANQKFVASNISFPDNLKIATTGSYLTYLYAVDKNQNQIYRYPRAEGGFGEKIDWLKDTLDLKDISSMAISENVYLVSEKSSVLKIFRGRVDKNWALESSATPWKPDQVYTGLENQYIFVLDKTNSRIGQFTPEGNLVKQFYSPELASAESLASDESNSLIYFSNSKGIAKFSYAQ